MTSSLQVLQDVRRSGLGGLEERRDGLIRRWQGSSYSREAHSTSRAGRGCDEGRSEGVNIRLGLLHVCLQSSVLSGDTRNSRDGLREFGEVQFHLRIFLLK